MEFSQIVYTILGGIVCKVYDDLNDMDILKSDRLNEVLKGLTWIFLTLISMNDFNFSAVLYAVNLVNSISNLKEWQNPYESSLLYLYPIFLILSFHTRAYLTFTDSIICILTILGSYIEPYILNEEISYKKIITRVIGIVNCSILLYLSSYFNISSMILKILYATIAYNITSVFFQVYQLSCSTADSSTNTIPIE